MDVVQAPRNLQPPQGPPARGSRRDRADRARPIPAGCGDCAADSARRKRSRRRSRTPHPRRGTIPQGHVRRRQSRSGNSSAPRGLSSRALARNGPAQGSPGHGYPLRGHEGSTAAGGHESTGVSCPARRLHFLDRHEIRDPPGPEGQERDRFNSRPSTVSAPGARSCL